MEIQTKYRIMKIASLVGFLELSYFMGDAAINLYPRNREELRSSPLYEEREKRDIIGAMASMIFSGIALGSSMHYLEKNKGDKK